MYNYKNGNANISISNNGTRIIECDGDLKLDYPLNIDMRVSTQCSFGFNDKTGKSICSFCHESAQVNGKECDYELLKQKISELPSGIELAIGCNKYTPSLHSFLEWCYNKGYICNLTINQGHVGKQAISLANSISKGYIKGLGISYRSDKDIKQLDYFKEYENSVVHVICGIDEIQDIIDLSNLGIKKILVLGEKDFGFNEGNVNLESKSHMQWYWHIHRLFKLFDVVSFDNLALQQLNIKRFVPDNKWSELYQGEYSFYINAVDGYFSPSSRNKNKTDWSSTTIKEYFNEINKK
jgi:hypothetical protein